jgi:hypothetical protein
MNMLILQILLQWKSIIMKNYKPLDNCDLGDLVSIQFFLAVSDLMTSPQNIKL